VSPAKLTCIAINRTASNIPGGKKSRRYTAGRAQRQLSSSGSSHANVVGHASGSKLNELGKNGHHAGHSLLHNTGSCNSALGCPIYIGNARAKKAHGIPQVQLLLNWVNGYYILVSCGACGIRISVARHDKLRYRLGWITAIVGKSGVHTGRSATTTTDQILFPWRE